MPIADVLPFLGGSPDAAVQATQGTPIQADLNSVAKGLGFPEAMIDRYGDVLNTRPRRTSDLVRDFALGVFQNDPMASTKMHMQVQEQFNQAVDRQIRYAREKEQADRERANFIWEAIGNARRFGGKHGKKLMKEVLGQAGIEVSPVVLDVMNDHEVMTNQLMEEIRSGELSGETLERMMVDPDFFGKQAMAGMQAIQTKNALVEQSQRIDRNKQLIREGQLRALKPGTSRERALDVLKLRNEMDPELAAQIIKEKYPEYDGVSDKKVQAFAQGRYERALTPRQELEAAMSERVTGAIRARGLPPSAFPGATPPPAAAAPREPGATTDDWMATSKPTIKR